MNLVLLVLVIAVIIAIAIVGVSKKKGEKETDYPYRKRNVLFSPAERSFLSVLKQVVEDDVEVFGKVRVADVIVPKQGLSRSNWQKAFNKITGKHFDYLLCNKNDLSIICAIELNDSSHNSKTRKERDIFIEAACKSANLPFIQLSAKATYNINQIRQSLAPYLPNIQIQRAKKESVTFSNEQSPNEIKKICPKCSSLMVKKTAKKGKHTGKEFWACSAFPQCRHIESIE